MQPNTSHDHELKSLRDLKSSAYGKELKCHSAIRVPKIISRSYWIVLLTIFVFSTGVLMLPWQQVSVGTGRVIAYSSENRQQNLEAPLMGKVRRWLVQEGEEVQKGQEVVELEDIDPNILTRLKNERDALLARREAARQSLTLSHRNLDRQRKLSEEGLSSERQFELAQIEVAKFEGVLSEVEAEIAQLEVRLSRQQSQVVKSPHDGELVRILVQEGSEVVNSGEPLAILVPQTTDRAVELKISGVDLPLVTKGRHVRLQFEGWPAVQFTGWPSVAVGTFGGEVEYIDALDDGQGNYRVLVFPDRLDVDWPSEQFLRQGVRTVGWVLLDEVPLWWEIWRRLNGFPMTVHDHTVDKSGLSQKH